MNKDILYNFLNNLPLSYLTKSKKEIELNGLSDKTIVFKVKTANLVIYLSNDVLLEESIKIQNKSEVLNFIFNHLNNRNCSFEGSKKLVYDEILNIINVYYSKILTKLTTEQNTNVIDNAEISFEASSSFETQNILKQAFFKKFREISQADEYEKEEHFENFISLCGSLYKKHMSNFDPTEQEQFKELNTKEGFVDKKFLKTLFIRFKYTFILTALRYIQVKKNLTNYISLETFGANFYAVYVALKVQPTEYDEKEDTEAKKGIFKIIKSIHKDDILIIWGLCFSEYFEKLFEKIISKQIVKMTETTMIQYRYEFLNISYSEIVELSLINSCRFPLRFIPPIAWDITSPEIEPHLNYSGGYEFNTKYQLRPLINIKNHEHEIKFRTTKVIDSLNLAQSVPFKINWKQFEYFEKHTDCISEIEYIKLNKQKKYNPVEEKQISKYLETKYLINDLKVLKKLYDNNIKNTPELTAQIKQLMFDNDLDFNFDSFKFLPENFLVYCPLALEWRLRFTQMASIGYLSSDNFRSFMSSSEEYSIQKEDLYPIISNVGYKSNDLAFLEDHFYNTKPNTKEIEAFVEQKKFQNQKIILFRILSEFFQAETKITDFGAVLSPKTDLLIGLDNTASGLQIQQICILNGHYKQELNLTRQDNIGDVYKIIGNKFISYLAVETEAISKEIINKAETIMKQAPEKKWAIEYSLDEAMWFNVTEKDYKETKKENLEDPLQEQKEPDTKIKVMCLPEIYGLYLWHEELKKLTNQNLRKLIKSLAMPASYNAKFQSLYSPIKDVLQSLQIETKYKYKLIALLIYKFLSFLNKDMNLLFFNNYLKNIAKIFKQKKKTFFWYHLSGAYITPKYMKRNFNKRIWVSIINPHYQKPKRKSNQKNILPEKSTRRSISLSKLEVDDSRLSSSLAPNLTHSIDSAIVHHIILNFDYVFSIHDCFLLRVSDLEKFKSKYPKYLEMVFKSTDPNYTFKQNFERTLDRPLFKVYLDFFFKQLNLKKETIASLLKKYEKDKTQNNCYSEILWKELNSGIFVTYK